MLPILAHIRPVDPSTGARVDIYVASSTSSAAMGLGGLPWEPAFAPSGRPTGSIELMSADMSAGIRPATANMKIQISSIKSRNAAALRWSGAPVTIYRADEFRWPSPIEFDGGVTSPELSLRDGTITLNMETSGRRLDVDLLTAKFDGDGNEGGDAEKYGTLRPFGAGRCLNIEVLFFDTIRSIAQIDGYGNTIAIDWLAEGLSSFGPAVADYLTYAALAVAIDTKAVKPGQWATCIAEGLIGLGAPPAGIITAHATFRNGLSGALMRALMVDYAKVPVDLVLTDTFEALDAAVPYPIHYWTAEQVKVKDVVEMIADGCNAVPIVTFQGKFAITRPFGGPVIATLTRGGYNDPAVTDWQVADPIVPVWQVTMRTARPERVMTRDEVLFEDAFVPRGLYDNDETYRGGHTVWTLDGAEWLFIGATPATGHAPPAAPVLVDAYWQQLRPPTKEQIADTYSTADPYDATANYSKGVQVLAQGARWIYTADAVWDHATAPPQLPAEVNAYWTLIRDAAAAALTTNVSAMTIQADYAGTPTSGQLPATGKATLKIGSADVTAAAAFVVATSGCDATIDVSGYFVVTAVRTSGYVDIRATYLGKTYSARVVITLNSAAPPSGGGGGGTPSANIAQFASVSTTTYPAAPAYTAQVAATAAGLTFSASLDYSVAPLGGGKVRGNAVLYLKVVYRVAGSGSGWTDAGAEQVGSEAYSTGSPDFESEAGYMEFSGIVVAGLTAGTNYEFGVVCRRAGNAATAPNGVVTGAGA